MPRAFLFPRPQSQTADPLTSRSWTIHGIPLSHNSLIKSEKKNWYNPCIKKEKKKKIINCQTFVSSLKVKSCHVSLEMTLTRDMTYLEASPITLPYLPLTGLDWENEICPKSGQG